MHYRFKNILITLQGEFIFILGKIRKSVSFHELTACLAFQSLYKQLYTHGKKPIG